MTNKTNLLLDDFNHFLADKTNFGSLGIRFLFFASVAFFSKTNAEQSQQISVSCFYCNIGFNKSLKNKIVAKIILLFLYYDNLK